MALDQKTSLLLILLTVLLPLLASIACLTLHFRKQFWIPVAITAASVITSFLLLLNQNLSLEYHWEWFATSKHVVNVIVITNSFTISMLVVVSVIATLVHIYSLGYMKNDSGLNRYMATLGFFTFSMQALVVSGNLLQLFIFWELVGFTSYLLIGFWREKQFAAFASQKAFLMNRVGDLGFIVGLLIIWTQAGTLEINKLQGLNETWATIAGSCIFLGVISKSAQFPLFSWLADAMEGPTPVSALIHAATMVAAGVYLLVQLFPIFTETTLDLMLIIGTITSLLGALAALAQDDIKKILAYSTVSQLGLMIVGIGSHAPEASFLHLFTHAFFKAGLFLAAGSIIHSTHQQALNQLGGLRKKLPITFLITVITGASLAGLPLFSGFISKEALLGAAWQLALIKAGIYWIVPLIILTTSIITSLYVFRLIWFTFFGETQTNHSVVESPLVMTVPMIILAIASCFVIVSTNPLSISSWLSDSIPTTTRLPMVLAIACSVGGTLIGYFVYKKQASNIFSFIILKEAFYIDLFYTRYVAASTVQTAKVVSKIDRKWIDQTIHIVIIAQVAFAHGIAWIDHHFIDGSVRGAAKLTRLIGTIARSIQGGKIQQYLVWAAIGILLFIIFTLL